MEAIYNLKEDELNTVLIQEGYKKYTFDQLRDWLYKKKVSSFDEMTNLKKEVIVFLKRNYFIERLPILKKESGEDVAKYLLSLSDGLTIECVLMKHDYGYSLCLSTQVGCSMGCLFCESGTLKKVRDLSLSEMVSQFMTVEDDAKHKISSVVIMGIGEPFDNYDNTVAFINVLNNDEYLGLGARHITVSTCGLIPKIRAFINDDIKVNLAISLHAANDELRTKLMPINKVYPLKDLMMVLKEYQKKSKKRITFEYILLNGVNDSVEDAIRLAKMVKGLNCYINLIPFNKMSNLHLKRSENSKIADFYDILKKEKVMVTTRKEYGDSISASCGQLSSGHKEEV